VAFGEGVISTSSENLRGFRSPIMAHNWSWVLCGLVVLTFWPFYLELALWVTHAVGTCSPNLNLTWSSAVELQTRIHNKQRGTQTDGRSQYMRSSTIAWLL